MAWFSDDFLKDCKEGDQDSIIESIVDGLDRSEHGMTYEVREDGNIEVIFKGDELVPTTRWLVKIQDVTDKAKTVAYRVKGGITEL